MTSKLDRRRFLRESAFAGAGVVLAGTTGVLRRSANAAEAPRRGPNEEIRTALLGINGQGRHHIDYLQASQNVRIVTLCDPDERLFPERIGLVKGGTPKTEKDLRRVLEDQDVDCVSIAAPNYWHALATVWACQAGKDVLVEKPATYCIAEGPKMIEAARKYGRVVQVMTHLRAKKGRQEAMRLLRAGLLGDLYMARGLVFRPRESMAHADDSSVPEGVDYDLWCGPAAMKTFNTNRFHYNWHWFWEYGNGEIGNNGPHVTDLAIEGLDKQDVLPIKIASQGGRFVWKDQGETANTQMVTYRYEDGVVFTLEVRNLASNQESGVSMGVIFYGSKGYMIIHLDGKYETVIDGQPGPQGSGDGRHRELAANFFEVVRSRDKAEQLAPIEYGHIGSALCHLGNIAYRLGRSVEFDPQALTFGGDAEANALLTRTYREPFVMPARI
ncbi:MAG: Gfo/Idh/MocA family oxidoreductase [Phycisphaerales bacterium]|nr:Gfo/Idh/MocA family oxidoreductase [Phycisphaerales bacterium]